MVAGDTLLVGDLQSGGSLVAAGLRQADRIRAVDGETGPGTGLLRRMQAAPVGGHLTLTVIRGGRSPEEQGADTGAPAGEILTLELDVEADTIMRVTGFGSVEDPTPRQLHVRSGLVEGHTRTAPPAGG
jgi:hypothetical protein